MAAATTSIALPVEEASQVGQARRATTALAQELGFDEVRQGAAAIIATELAQNLVKHGKGGQLVLRTISTGAASAKTGESKGIQMLALDRGPGMSNVAASLMDGYSTAGTAGQGLGAVQRMSDHFDVHSAPGLGAAVLAEVWRRKPSLSSATRPEVGGVSVPAPYEQVCGDAWAVRRTPEATWMVIADGLGHGPLAAEASGEAIAVFQSVQPQSAADMLQDMHGALKKTRGAAVSVARIDLAARKVDYAGIGNIGGIIWNGQSRRSMIALNGTVGHQLRTIRAFTYDLEGECLVVLASDGLQSQWQVDRYPGLSKRSAALIAGVLYRDFRRGRDDATVVVARVTD